MTSSWTYEIVFSHTSESDTSEALESISQALFDTPSFPKRGSLDWVTLKKYLFKEELPQWLIEKGFSVIKSIESTDTQSIRALIIMFENKLWYVLSYEKMNHISIHKTTAKIIWSVVD